MQFCRPPLLGFCLIIGIFLAYLSAHAQISAQKMTIYTLQQPTLYQINISEKTALEYVVIGFESSRDYPLALLNNLYRIIQELLNNIIKHAGASNAYLELVAEQGQLRIIVDDNGKGFDSSLAMRSSGIGLENIRAKLSLYNGEMEITRKPEHGTLVVIRIPLS
ncbi:hypothetical protein AQ505_14240 [Pedobacter sp. PACM 27299]|nr:hypothetical protein AQ505_14240 [Pedobacter sp. PACM 27299]